MNPVMSQKTFPDAGSERRVRPSDVVRLDDSLRPYGTLIGQLRQAERHGAPMRTVGVVSCHRQDGSAQICRRLAECAAMIIGEEVLLIDTRTTHIAHTPRNVAIRLGHAEFLAGKVELHECIRTTPTPQLFLLPSSPAHMGASAYDPTVLDQAVARCQSRFELTIVDLGMLDSAGNLGLLAAKLDGVILVLAPQTTKTSAVKQCKQALERMGVTLLGAVMSERQSA